MSNNSLHDRPLDDLDVRKEETDAGMVADGVEFATFAEGEYVESVLVDRARATAIYRDLGAILGETARNVPRSSTVKQAIGDRETATLLAALRYWRREGLMSAGDEQDIAEDGGRFDSLSAPEIDSLCEKINCADYRPSDAKSESTTNIDLSNMPWADISLDKRHRGSRLLGALQVNGVNHHLEAIEVWSHGSKFTQSAVCSRCDAILLKYRDAAGAEGPFNTVTINRRQYVVFVSPMCH